MPENILGLNVPLLVQGWLQSKIQLSARWWCLWDLTRGKADGWQSIYLEQGTFLYTSSLVAPTFSVRTEDQSFNTLF